MTNAITFQRFMYDNNIDWVDLDFDDLLYMLHKIQGTSIGFMLLKQPPRARNQLKRVAKLDWTPEYGDDLESCWLLLSDIYIQVIQNHSTLF